MRRLSRCEWATRGTFRSVRASSIPCVVYAAKSTEDRRGSIPDQLHDCCEAVASAGERVLVAEYSDEACSAFLGDRGPGLVDAMRHAEDLTREWVMGTTLRSPRPGRRALSAARRRDRTQAAPIDPARSAFAGASVAGTVRSSALFSSRTRVDSSGTGRTPKSSTCSRLDGAARPSPTGQGVGSRQAASAVLTERRAAFRLVQRGARRSRAD